MIPRLVHLCWFGGNAKNDCIQKCEASVKKFFKEEEIMYWTDDNCPKFPCLEEFRKYKKWALISDYVRLWALYEYGGIYLDSDVEIVKTFDHLLSKDCCLVGFEKESLEAKSLSNGVIIAPRHNEFIKECLKILVSGFITKIKPFYGVKVVNIVASQRGLLKYGPQCLSSDLEILPKEIFYPEKENITALTCGIHHYEGSWHSKNSVGRAILNHKHRMHRILTILNNRVLRAGIFSASKSSIPRKFSKKEFENIVKFNEMIEECLSVQQRIK